MLNMIRTSYNRIPSLTCWSSIQKVQIKLKSSTSSKESRTLVKSSKLGLDTNVNVLSEKVKETTKTASYLGVILIGVGVTGTLLYAVFRELFSSLSPNSVFSAAVKRCLSDSRVEDKLGAPISAYGEENRRGRRQHPAYLGFLDDRGRKHLRMKFFLQGCRHKATVHLEMVENDSGYYDYKYMVVDINDYLNTRLTLEDESQIPKDLSPPAEFSLV